MIIYIVFTNAFVPMIFLKKKSFNRLFFSFIFSNGTLKSKEG